MDPFDGVHRDPTVEDARRIVGLVDALDGCRMRLIGSLHQSGSKLPVPRITGSPEAACGPGDGNGAGSSKPCVLCHAAVPRHAQDARALVSVEWPCASP